MNKEKYVFAQLISFLNEDNFRRVVNKYQGNHYIKHFIAVPLKSKIVL